MEHVHKPYVHETKRIPCLKHAWSSLQIVYHFEAHPLHHIIVLTGWTKFVLVLILLWVKVFHEYCNCLSLCDFGQIKVVPVFMAVHGCACPQSGSKATLYQKYLKRKKCLLALFTFSTLIGIFTSLQIAVPFHCLWKDQAATTKYEKKTLKTPKSKSH